MKRILTCVVVIFSLTISKAQNTLTFDKSFIQGLDKWIALQPDKNGSYGLGFVYFDNTAGLTLDYKGTFTIDKDGKFISKIVDENTMMKKRLSPTDVAVAIIPESKFEELKVDKVPEWLAIYNNDKKVSAEKSFKMGFLHNAWNDCETASTHLQKAKKLDPNYKGLNTELAYSYNCLERYDDAILVLKDALKSNPTDAYTHKELIFSQAKSGNLKLAEESCLKAEKICTDKTYLGENAFQILQGYFLNKDIKNFDRWLTINETNFENDKRFPSIITKMKVEIKL